ncbi:CHAT domain-containing protein [Streptomyces sp. T028]|uniref:CHAT domain-containing protein n=1 Tax=Streptomyces sp. T028 TaxID=3394379 RepID=UPI003A8589B4
MSSPDPASDPHRAGLAALSRYRVAGEAADLASAVSLLSDAARAPSDAEVSLDLTDALLDRYDRYGARPQDRSLDEALDILERPEATSHVRGRLLLAHALLERYERDGSPEDQLRALALQQQAAAEDGHEAAHLDSALANLGVSLAESTDPDDVDQAVALLHAQLTATDADHPERGNRLSHLGNALLRSAEREGHDQELEQAIEAFSQAVHTPQGFAVHGYGWLGNLGNGLSTRFERGGDPADLRSAITCFRDALRACPDDSPSRAACLSNLANGLLDRFESEGEPGDLQEAVAHLRAAIDRTPPHGILRAARLSNLSTALLDSFEANGNLDDLDEAISVCRQAVAVAPKDSTDAPLWHTNLGNALMAAHEAGRKSVLDEAVEMYTQAVALVPRGHRERALYLSNLGTALAARQDRDSLRKAIGLFTEAVSATSRRSPRRATWVNNVANGHSDLYDVTGRRGDLRKAIRWYRRALRMTPVSAPEYAAWSYNLASATATLWRARRIPRGTGRLRRLYRRTCELAGKTATETALSAARSWARWAEDRGAWAEAAEAYRHATKALGELLDAQLLLSHKHLRLSGALGLPARSAHAHARAGDLARAVTEIEHGRAVQLTEALDHAFLERAAAAADSPLAARLRRIGADVRRLMVPAMAGPNGTSADLTDAADLASWREATDAEIADRRRVKAELREAAAEVRRLSGSAVATGPSGRAPVQAPQTLAYLIPTDLGGTALILRSGDPDDTVAVALPDLNTHAVGERAKQLAADYARRDGRPDRWRESLDDVAEWLWDSCMGPVLERVPEGSSLALVAVGQLGLLPLHAAWTPSEQGRRYALDHATISYVPNARAAAAADVAAAERATGGLLAVQDPRPVPLGPLPFAKPDVNLAARFFNPVKRLSGSDATVAAVREALSSCSVGHFACHAHADTGSPMDSALVLSEGRLRLRDLLTADPNHSPVSARLVVLGACETYVAGSDLPDEVISLAMGFVQLGAAGIVASHWVVGGLANSLVTARFYREWQLLGLSPAESLCAAQRWVRQTTNKEKVEWLRPAHGEPELPIATTRLLWRELVRRPSEGVDFAHPADWAAYSHMGA